MIAALFVESRGVYTGLPDVDPWDIKRDARLYAGPHPVVAHPPCQRWGRYWHGGPSVKERKTLGDDGGCFASALASVRKYGGVIEHPEASHAWETFKLAAPPKFGGWIRAGDGIGWTCCVEQGNYGHKARKATWLYVTGVNDLPELKWGAAEVAQPVLSETHQRRASGEVVPNEFLGGSGDEGLAAMAGHEQASHSVHGWSKVIAIPAFDRTGVQGHADPNHGIRRPRLRVERQLSVQGRRRRLRSGRESGAKCVAHCFEDVPLVLGNRLPHQGVVASDRRPHRGGMGFPKLRAPLDVGEEKCYSPGWNRFSR